MLACLLAYLLACLLACLLAPPLLGLLSEPKINVFLKVVPFPDPDTGLIYQPENENSISFTSEFLVYNPKLKYTMNFPGIDFCGDNGGVMLLVGTFPAVRKNSS